MAALGAEVHLVGLVGDDPSADRLLNLLERSDIRVGAIVRSPDRPTIVKTRIIAHHQQVVRFDREESPPPDSPAARRLQAWVLGRLRRIDVLVVSDYGKGTINPALLEALAAAHSRRPFTWVVDPKRSNFPHYRRASLVKPNLQEAAAADVEIRDAASLRTAGVRLLARWDAEAVLVSRGEQGMALFRRGQGIREFASAARDVFDVTGAGDTVVATCALALGAGATLEEAAVLANHAAGIVVGKSGTATVTAAELAAAVRDG